MVWMKIQWLFYHTFGQSRETELHFLRRPAGSAHRSRSVGRCGRTSLDCPARLNYLPAFKTGVQRLLLKNGNSTSVMEHVSIKLIFWVADIRRASSSNWIVSCYSLQRLGTWTPRSWLLKTHQASVCLFVCFKKFFPFRDLGLISFRIIIPCVFGFPTNRTRSPVLLAVWPQESWNTMSLCTGVRVAPS